MKVRIAALSIINPQDDANAIILSFESTSDEFGLKRARLVSCSPHVFLSHAALRTEAPEPGTFNQMTPSEPSYHKARAYRPLWESITHKDVGKFAQRDVEAVKRDATYSQYLLLMFTVYVYLPLPPFIQNLISPAL